MKMVANNKTRNNSNRVLIWQQNRINGFITKDFIDLLVQNNFKLQISTLGPEGTSSEYASNFFLDLLQIDYKSKAYLKPSFEEAVLDVLNLNADIMVVANAYQNIDAIYMEPKMKVMSSFMCNTPPYGIACKNHNVLIGQEKKINILTHPAPVSMIPWFLNDTSIEYNIHASSSTSKAAESVMHEQFKYCVTNEIAVKKYNLAFISRTRPIKMLWSVFGLAAEN